MLTHSAVKQLFSKALTFYLVLFFGGVKSLQSVETTETGGLDNNCCHALVLITLPGSSPVQLIPPIHFHSVHFGFCTQQFHAVSDGILEQRLLQFMQSSSHHQYSLCQISSAGEPVAYSHASSPSNDNAFRGHHAVRWE